MCEEEHEYTTSPFLFFLKETKPKKRKNPLKLVF